MKEEGDVVATRKNPRYGPSSVYGRHRARLAVAVTAAGVAGIGLLFGALDMSGSFASTGGAQKAPQTNCAAVPSKCGFPDGTNSGVPKGTALKSVPGQVSRGTGWHFDSRGWVEVDGNGAVLSGLSMPYNVKVTASNVTLTHDQIVTGGTYGVSLADTTGVTITNSTISGLNATTGRLDYAISDPEGTSTGMVIKSNNISDFRCGVSVTTGLIANNYIHDPGYISGDHTNGIIGDGGTQQMTMTHNTIFNSLTQTDAITINTSTVPGPVTNKVIENNLLAGAGYPIYGGAGFGHTTSGILIENNRFGQQYYPKSGEFGPVLNFVASGAGNVWSGNVWDSTGATVPAP
jgi:hypothetical protein